MADFVSNLFSSDGFVPRWQCGDWPAALMWTHVVSDALIWLAYMAIPAALLYFIWRRGQEIPFPRIFWLFGLFIIACGFTHFIEVFAFAHPMYRLSGVVKGLTAGVSLLTVVGLVRVMPEALALPGLRDLNESLRAEIARRELAEERANRLNRELIQSVQQLRTVLDNIPVGVAVSNDPRCDSVQLNEFGARLLKTPPQTRLALSSGPQAMAFEIFKDGSPVPTEEIPMIRAVRTGLPVVGAELELRFPDHARTDLLVYATPLLDEQGAVTGCIGVYVDETARRLTAERARAFESRMLEKDKRERLGVLAGGVAHDFNNLLAVMLGHVELARVEIDPASRALEFLENVENAIQRAADLTRQMLAYSGKGQFILSDVRLNPLIEEMITLLEASISKKVRIVTDLAPRLPVVRADSGQMSQIILNLVTNAADALNGEPGSITIRTSVVRPSAAEFARGCVPLAEPRGGDYVCLEVLDTGCGIAADVLPRIFDPFFTTRKTGRGLGLAAVYGAVSAHEGTIVVDTTPGLGTNMRVLLPAAAAQDTPAVEPAAAAPALSGSGALVLVVDDVDSLRCMAADMIRRGGYRALTAADGREALEVFSRHAEEIDLVLLDLMMPGLSGQEVCARLQTMRPGVRVILSSGYNEQSAIEPETAARIAGFLQKPYTMKKLLDMLARVLAGESAVPRS